MRTQCTWLIGNLNLISVEDRLGPDSEPGTILASE